MLTSSSLRKYYILTIIKSVEGFWSPHKPESPLLADLKELETLLILHRGKAFYAMALGQYIIFPHRLITAFSVGEIVVSGVVINQPHTME